MKVPLVISSYKNTLRVAYNKQYEKIDVSVPVFDTKVATDVFDVVGHGQMSLGIKYVDGPIAYNMFKDKCPITFFNQLYSTKANPCNNYPNTNDIDMFYYDIETLTKGNGRFPKAETDPVICIGAALNDNDVKIFADYNTGEYRYEDGKILNDFLNFIEETDPDVYVGYNSYDFDMPYLLTRMEMNDLPWWKLYRMWHKHRGTQNEQQAIKYIQEYKDNSQNKSDYLGRIHYDIYIVDVKRDQLLNDLKDRKMKTLAKHCGFADVVELGDDVKDTQKLMMQDKDRLIRYQISDVRQTRSICKRYFPLNIALAEHLNTPLETMISRSNGTPSTLFLLKEMYAQNYFVIDSNSDRYKQLYLLNPKFQGAINGILKTGYIEQMFKYDFKNMYPSSMWTWNLGPDTTRIERLTEYTGDYHFKRVKNNTEDVLLMEIPDANYNRQLHISINMSHPSFTKNAIEKLWTERAKFKQIQQETDDPKIKADAKTRDNGIKVLLNTIYGLNGNTHSIGDLAVAIAVTAMCRWTTEFVINILGDSVVEIDTDGIATDQQFNAEEINQKIADTIKEQMGIETSRMIIEDEWGENVVKAFMYRMKNYVLEINGEIIKHGVSMKSSSKPKCYDDAITAAIDYTFKRNDMSYQELLDKILNLKERPISDFIITTRLNKDISEYQNAIATGRSITAKIINQVKEYKGINVSKDDTIEYIHCIDNISGQSTPYIPELAVNARIDWDKYEKLMKPILTIFKLVQDVDIKTFDKGIEQISNIDISEKESKEFLLGGDLL